MKLFIHQKRILEFEVIDYWTYGVSYIGTIKGRKGYYLYDESTKTLTKLKKLPKVQCYYNPSAGKRLFNEHVNVFSLLAKKIKRMMERKHLRDSLAYDLKAEVDSHLTELPNGRYFEKNFKGDN